MSTGQVYYNPKFGYYTLGGNAPIGIGSMVEHGENVVDQTLWDSRVKQGLIKPLAGISTQAPSAPSYNTASISTAYTPNKYTANQLAGLNGNGGGMGGNANTIPRWMQQAYANKMAGMQAPANGPLPYKLTDSSYRGMPASGNQVAPVGVAGKAAPKAGV